MTMLPLNVEDVPVYSAPIRATIPLTSSLPPPCGGGTVPAASYRKLKRNKVDLQHYALELYRIVFSLNATRFDILFLLIRLPVAFF